MASSDAEICNLALSHIGIGKQIQNLATDKTEAGQACQLFYPQVLREVLEEWKWPFATRFQELAVVNDNTGVPGAEWAFDYRYPTDALRIRRILSGNRNPSRQARVPYRIGGDNDGLLLMTDMRDACAEYTALVEDVIRYPNSFVQAFSLKIALYIVPRIAQGDPFQMRERIAVLYNQAISTAEASAANELQPDEEPASEFQRFRDGPTSFNATGENPLDFLGIT